MITMFGFHEAVLGNWPIMFIDVNLNSQWQRRISEVVFSVSFALCLSYLLRARRNGEFPPV